MSSIKYYLTTGGHYVWWFISGIPYVITSIPSYVKEKITGRHDSLIPIKAQLPTIEEQDEYIVTNKPIDGNNMV